METYQIYLGQSRLTCKTYGDHLKKKKNQKAKYQPNSMLKDEFGKKQKPIKKTCKPKSTNLSCDASYARHQIQ